MKTKFIFRTIGILIVILLFLMTNCKKDQHVGVQNQKVSISDEDLKLSRIIENFKEKGKSHLKDDERMSVDSALWYLEATANYTYGDGSREIEEMTTDSSIIRLQKINDSIELNEVYTKYELMIDSIRQYYQSISESEKQLIAVNVEPISITSTELTCKVKYTFATGNFPTIECNFNSSDGWEPFGALYNIGGICSGPNTGQYPDKDAASEIQRKIMLCKGVPIGNCYYDPVIELEIHGSEWSDPNYMGGLDSINYTSHYVYYNLEGYPGYEDCIPPDDCNYYLNGTKHVIYTSENASNPGLRPDGYSFILLRDFIGDVCVCIPGWTEHWGYVQYGVLHVSPHLPDKLD